MTKPCTPSVLTARRDARFMRHVRVVDATGCWEWVGWREKGYGRLRERGRCLRAHRVAWERAHGPIPDGFDVLHSCDNPPCVNVAHLHLGTHDDNMAEMAERGRASRASVNRGDRNGMSKLTIEDVRAIRSLAGSMTHREIGARFGISRAAAGDIIAGRRWRHAS